MSNLTECAFPCQETPGPNTSFSPGFTKHEYAAIILAGHIAAKPSFGASDPDNIANAAYKIAKAVLSKFE